MPGHKHLRDPSWDLRKVDLRAKLTAETARELDDFVKSMGWSKPETVEYLLRYAITCHEAEKCKK